MSLLDSSKHTESSHSRASAIAVRFDGGRVSIEQVVAVAKGGARVELSTEPEFVRRIDKGAEFLDRLLLEDGVIYGVTTGYGDSCTVAVPPDLVEELPVHLTRFHGCGMGAYFDVQTSLAVLATRLASLSQGFSGVRYELLDKIALFINNGLAPRIPEEGSVGASGDLTPLSYLAAALIGEREVTYHGEVMTSLAAMDAANITPLKLRPKEGLAIMNGTAVMTAIACLAYSRAEYLCQLSARITAMSSIALAGNSNHFDELLFSAKPHPGQNQVAGWIRDDINHVEHPRNSDRLQDRYSIRCAPHIIGVLQDALPWMRQNIENELNSANDNPIIDGEGEHVLHGGHFYGGHIAFVMDSMKNCVANLADLMDRQMALLMDVKFNNGLPPNLSAAAPGRTMVNHGFKAVQIGMSAWTAEALKLTMPASVFSRSTECHNQDKVSMGTIAARDCIRVLELTEQVAAAELLAATQGIKLRLQKGDITEASLSQPIKSMLAAVSAEFDMLEEDRPLEASLRQFVSLIQQQQWDIYG
ncbi:histidine ammonia-lyase [Oceanicoccus sp. KOV_DT_Chl]|uniref:HAL/PAL/TAL family ammonia-lyase n=1 Tax=Oceanicoccus sp. KOV_DT_Chl TaxID=1904639 RepID=UPI000C7B6FB6|nr:aromatic amino acid ammonia-lyase [Oceanicoccus sp. KOV_DT_Chl]